MRRESIKIAVSAVLTALVLMFLQSTAGVFFRNAAVIPDVFFIFSLAFACSHKKITRVIAAAVLCGILSDVCWHTKFSWCMLIYSCGAVLMFYLKNFFLHPNIFFVSVIAFGIFIVGKCAMYPIIYKMVKFADFFANDVIYSAFYNLACFFVVTLIFEMIEKRRAAKYDSCI